MGKTAQIIRFEKHDGFLSKPQTLQEEERMRFHGMNFSTDIRGKMPSIPKKENRKPTVAAPKKNAVGTKKPATEKQNTRMPAVMRTCRSNGIAACWRITGNPACCQE